MPEATIETIPVEERKNPDRSEQERALPEKQNPQLLTKLRKP